MSQSALMRATKAILQSSLSLNDTKCDMMSEGMPPANCGQEFIAIHEGEWRADEADFDYGLTEYFGVKVTITHKIGHVPIEKVSSREIYAASSSLESRARQIIAIIHMEYEDLMNEANALIPNDEMGFCEPLRYLGADGPPRLVGSSWFSAAMTQGGREDVGVIRTLNFGRAKRVQDISSLRNEL